MRLARNIARLVAESLRFGLATRRVGVVVVVVVGLVLLALGLSAQAVAPLAIYPFA